MSYNIRSIGVFEKQARRLSRKYPSLKNDLLLLVESLKESPFQGTSLGNNCFKIRLAVRSKRKGKSGGARIITHIVIVEKLVYLLSIYDKSEKADLSAGELKLLLSEIAG
jgi:mRNA-degrading endonuclease RelE of RelBE toxin-antitoxin system